MSLLLSGTNGLSDVDGSAATPAIRGTDANTGIFFPAADTIAFAEGGAEVMRIDSSGNVGIGTSSPSFLLDVQSAAATGRLLSTTGTNTVQFSVVNTGGSFYHAIESGAGSNFGVTPYSAVLWNTGAYPIVFATTNAERARIDSSGNLLVGTTGNLIAGAKIRTTSGSACFEAEITNGAGGGANYWANRTASDGWVAAWYRGGTGAGSISLAGASTAYNTSSDYRLKENVQPLMGALQRVSQLRPVVWEWKKKFEGSSPTGEGFIAHEVQEICPAAVSGEKDAVNEDGSIKPQGIDTSFLVATLTAAIQEQQAIITALTARVEALEGTQP
jgi:hypothetical protein